MKTRILAVRHGETEWNKAGIQQGHLNSNLTDAGISQAKALAEGLKAYEIDAFYCSDLGRAVETAEEISRVIGKRFIKEERLKERNLGSMQGLSKKEFADKYPEEWKKFQSGDSEYRLPGGESSKDRYVRAIECVEDLVERNKGKTILIVSHGGIVMSLFYRALRIPLHNKRAFSLYNGSINVLSISEEMEWFLELWNDTSHLMKNGIATLDDN